MSALVGLQDAAAALGITARQLRRDIEAGCPVARRGARGRGRATLLCLESVRRWRAAREQPTDDQVLLELAAELPQVLAGAAWEAFRLVEGADKRRQAGVIAGCWTVMASLLLDHLRQRHPDLPGLAVEPEEIIRLRAIFSGCGDMASHQSTSPRSDR